MTRWGGREVGRISHTVGLVLAAAALAVVACVVAAFLFGVSPSDELVDAARRDARDFGWPIVIAVIVVAFLAFQHRADRHERKLADAPLDQGERLRFK